MDTKTCAECGSPFVSKRDWALFCSPDHKRAFHARAQTRGHMLVTFMQVHRRGGDGKRAATETSRYAFGQACKLLDRWNAEDKAAGRQPALVVEGKMEAGWDAVDLS